MCTLCRVIWLSDGEDFVILAHVALTQRQPVTEKQTEKRTIRR